MIPLDPPMPVVRIARTLEEAGYETWAVGGVVRDALFDVPSADWDLATRAPPRVMRRLFRRTVPVGIDHGTVGILEGSDVMYEVTTFRRDVETTGRRAVVEFADTIEEDLARRDFTINAVAWHPLRRRVFDPYGGTDDVRVRRLRTVGRAADRFAEDYLRVLRALRFAGRFRLRIEDATWRALCGAVPGMERLSAERVKEELDKILAHEAPPSRALSLYAASGALGFLYPELEALVDRDGGGDAPGGGAWTTALRAADLLPARDPELRLAALLHAVGEPESGGFRDDPVPDGSPIRERASLRTAALLVRLRSSNARIGRVGAVVGAVADPPSPDASPASLRRWLAAVGRTDAAGALRVLAAVFRARAVAAHGTGAPTGAIASLLRRLRAELTSGAPLSEGELALGGRDLIRMGFRPGPGFGVVLRTLLERVLEDPTRNEASWLATEAETLLEARSAEVDGAANGGADV